jgi:hypothetical protein
MALPLLIPIIVGAAGLFGAGKAVKGVVDSKEADGIASRAIERTDDANKKLELTKKATNDLLSSYGQKKLDALDKQVQDFVTLFRRLENLKETSSEELNNLQLGKFSEVNIAELQHSCELAHGAIQGVGAGAIGGALTAFGAYNGTMLLASAGTGTAISTLSGAAATNATLAWLGGGAIGTGLGVAGGAFVLGTLVAGPALLIFGSVFGAKASTKLSEAKANREKSFVYVDEIESVCQKLGMIQQVTQLASDVLSTLRTKLRRANDSLRQVISDKGVDTSTYDQESQKIIFIAYEYALMLKSIIDTPILNENGELLESSHRTFASIEV